MFGIEMNILSDFLLLLCYYHVNGATFRLTDLSKSTYFEGDHTEDGLSVAVIKDGKLKLRGFIPGNLSSEALIACDEKSSCEIENRKEGSVRSLTISANQHGFSIIEMTSNRSDLIDHAFLLNSTSVHWFGGPELSTQFWPLENVSLTSEEAYIPKHLRNSGVSERYWLNSNGAFIFVDDQVPLFVDQNHQTNDTVYFIAQNGGPYVRRLKVQLNYTISVHDDAKQAHLFAVNNFLGKPSGHPNIKMIKEPIWTTWAKYKKNINDSVVIDFAKEIREHNYTGGQYEIDDDWETCYGAQEFNNKTFPNINGTVQALKDLDFRVSLWIHPFVDDNCKERSQEGISKGYFVQNTSGSTKGMWWNSNNSHTIDFTNSEAVEWFSNRVKILQTSLGIDSFKFDGGESTSWGPEPPIFPHHPNVYDWPMILTQEYLKTVSKFGDLIEFRAGWRTQQLSNFMRIIDKDSNWSFNNGLPTVITSLMSLNMVGYGMILPDMVGGNGYSKKPTAQLLVRWAQANTFMPAMQFSYLPWDFKNVSYDIEAIVKNCVDLHEEYTPSIVKAMENNIAYGTPVNAPIWWIDPTDEIALTTWDEFLLGEDILVAPVVVENATQRTVYLPKGTWRDGNNKSKTFTGPVSLTYDAPIDVLPYFLKI